MQHGHAAWKKHNGVYAVVNLRGGSEYGDSWHEQGMLLNKQNVFDDFAYAAKFLHASKIGSPETTAIIGGSNGGPTIRTPNNCSSLWRSNL